MNEIARAWMGDGISAEAMAGAMRLGANVRRSGRGAGAAGEERA